MLKSLQIRHWRQYEKLDIQFHDKLTILTGANGSGKTTILNLISQQYGWSFQYVSTPIRTDVKTGVLFYVADLWKHIFEKNNQVVPANYDVIGSIEYKHLPQQQAQIAVPHDVAQVYQPQFFPHQQLKGFHVPSHRPIYTYQGVGSIPTQPISKEQAFTNYSNEIRSRYSGGYSGKNANYVIKETLISLATFGYGNQIVVPNHAARDAFEKFQDILRAVFPPKLGFKKISIRIPEVVFETDSGDFSLDAVSGGVAAIIDLAWQLFNYSPTDEPFVVTIDEPENHLHPELQQTLLPSLLKAFPHVQFIVATHSPFMVSAVADSNVFVLDYNQDKKVESEFLETINKAGTSNEILREVLGLPFTMPIWVENKLENIIKRYEEKEINQSTLDQLRAELESVGLEKFVPDAIAQLVTPKDRQ